MHGRKRVLALILAWVVLAINGVQAQAASVQLPGSRPFNLYLPSNYDASVSMPLVIALHGFNQSGSEFENYLKLEPLAQSRDFLYVALDGTADSHGVRFWNATPECCDFQTPKVNDDAYIMSVIDQISQSYNVDQNRIYVIGHSNGGFMVNELACAHSDRIAAVVDIAGGNFGKLSLCKPTAPISVLELWGTKDVTYKQNHIMGKYIAGALTSIQFWADQEKCSAPELTRAALDLDRKVIGRETDLISYPGCSGNSSVQFWRMNGVGHVPALSTSFSADLIDFLFAHPKSAQ